MDTYPQTIYANVLLYQDKIINWNIGLNPLNLATLTVPYPIQKDQETLRVETQSFIAQNKEEYHEIFQTTAPKWIFGWAFHKMFNGMIP